MQISWYVLLELICLSRHGGMSVGLHVCPIESDPSKFERIPDRKWQLQTLADVDNDQKLPCTRALTAQAGQIFHGELIEMESACVFEL